MESYAKECSMQLRPFLCLLLSLWGGEVFEKAAAAAYLASLHGQLSLLLETFQAEYPEQLMVARFLPLDLGMRERIAFGAPFNYKG